MSVSRSGKDQIRIEGFSRLPAPPFPLSDFVGPDSDESELIPVLTNWAAEVNPELAPFIAASSAIIIGLPQDLVTCRVLSVPFTQEGRISRLLPVEVESNLLDDSEDLLFDYSPLARNLECTRLISAALDRTRLRGCLDHLKLLSMDPSALTATGLSFHRLARLFADRLGNGTGRVLFLHLAQDRAQLGAVEGGATVFALPLPKPFTGEGNGNGPELSPRFLSVFERSLHFLESYSADGGGCPPPVRQVMLLGEAADDFLAEKLSRRIGLPVRPFRLPDEALEPGSEVPREFHADLAPALALALQPLQPGRAVNFRREEFTYRPESRAILARLIFPAILIALIVAASIVRVSISGSGDAQQVKAMIGQMQTMLKSVDPNAPPGDPAVVVKTLLEQAKVKSDNYVDLSSPEALDVLAAISAAIPPEIDVTVTAFEYKGDRASISGTTARLEDPNEITKRLSQVPIFGKVEMESSTKTNNDLYRFRINVNLKKGGGS